jgi:hypothetical protein
MVIFLRPNRFLPLATQYCSRVYRLKRAIFPSFRHRGSSHIRVPIFASSRCPYRRNRRGKCKDPQPTLSAKNPRSHVLIGDFSDDWLLPDESRNCGRGLPSPSFLWDSGSKKEYCCSLASLVSFAPISPVCAVCRTGLENPVRPQTVVVAALRRYRSNESFIPTRRGER